MESITPGVKLGESYRAYLLKSEMNYSYQEAATLVTIQKMVSFFSFFVINLCICPFVRQSGNISRFCQSCRVSLLVNIPWTSCNYVCWNQYTGKQGSRKENQREKQALHCINI